MQDGFIKVKAFNPTIKVANVTENTKAIISQLNNINGEKVVVFPRLCLTGANIGELAKTSTLLSSVERAIKTIARASVEVDALIFFGAPLRVKSKVYDCCVVVNNGKVLGAIPALKAEEGLDDFVSTIAQEKDGYPISNDIVFYCKGDDDFSVSAVVENSPNIPKIPPANIVVQLSSTAYYPNVLEHANISMEGISRSEQCGYILANGCDGDSTADNVVEPFVRYYFCGERLDDNCAVMDIKASAYRKNVRKKCDTLPKISINFSVKTEKTSINAKWNKFPFLPSGDNKDKQCLEIINMQAKGLKKRIESAKAKSAVLGISGGLDSTVALLVTVKAFDMMQRKRSEIIAVTMPGLGTGIRTKNNAVLMAEYLGVTLRTVDISEATKQHLADIGHDGISADITYENAQARERTQVLMDIANQTNGMVIGTGDLSEIALGWCTYNGDHISMYGVNSSIPKTLAKAILQAVANESEPQLQSVLSDVNLTPPSPELKPLKEGNVEQITEKEIGPYELHDFFLYHIIINGYGIRKLLRIATKTFTNYTEKEIEKWLRVFITRFFSMQFKRSCSPDGACVSGVSLSPRNGWKMPSDADASEWLAELDGHKK